MAHLRSHRAAIVASALLPSLGIAQHLERPGDAPTPRAPLHRPVAESRASVSFGPFESIQVNVDAFGNDIRGDASNEPTIVVDPTDPRRIVIGWRQFDTITSNFRQNGYAYSHDGGDTWRFPGSIEPGVFNSDPVLDADSAGTLFYLSYPGGRTLKVFRSTDGGTTFGQRTNLAGGDKPWMTVDRTGGIGDGNIYVIWQVVHGPNTFVRSTDGGNSFSTPVAVPSTPTFGTMSVAPDGTLYAAGLIRQNFGSFVVARSATAQDPARTPTFTSVPVSMAGNMEFAEPPNPGGLMGQAYVAADPSRPGHVYMLCSVDPSGSDPLDVHFVRSTDGGRSFAAPIRVNDDSRAPSSWQWFGTMSVAPDGRIDAVWNDTRDSQNAVLCDTRYAWSFDAGTTWSRNVQVGPRWNSVLGHPNQAKIGDYYHMVSDAAGAHLAYSTTYTGGQDTYYLRLGDCNENGVHDGLDIRNGTSFDSNQNSIPDECETCQTDLGNGNGPALNVCGDPLNATGSRATLFVENGLPRAPVFLLVSLGRLTPPTPLGGGAALVPDPALGFPVNTLVTDSNGRVGTTIHGGPSGPITVYVQGAMLDTTTSALLVTNAVSVELGY